MPIGTDVRVGLKPRQEPLTEILQLVDLINQSLVGCANRRRLTGASSIIVTAHTTQSLRTLLPPIAIYWYYYCILNPFQTN